MYNPTLYFVARCEVNGYCKPVNLMNRSATLLFCCSLVLGALGCFTPELFSQEFARYLTANEGMLVDSASQEEPASDAMEAIVEALRDAESRLAALEADRLVLSDAQNETGQLVDELLDDKEKAAKKKAEAEKNKKWFEKYTIRGYAQFRINDVIDESDGLAPAQHVGDSSVGENQSFLLRRARVIISGDVNDYISIYLQPDLHRHLMEVLIQTSLSKFVTGTPTFTLISSECTGCASVNLKSLTAGRTSSRVRTDCPSIATMHSIAAPGTNGI